MTMTKFKMSCFFIKKVTLLIKFTTFSSTKKILVTHFWPRSNISKFFPYYFNTILWVCHWLSTIKVTLWIVTLLRIVQRNRIQLKCRRGVANSSFRWQIHTDSARRQSSPTKKKFSEKILTGKKTFFSSSHSFDFVDGIPGLPIPRLLNLHTTFTFIFRLTYASVDVG
jgi:hypothetical protein